MANQPTVYSGGASRGRSAIIGATRSSPPLPPTDAILQVMERIDESVCSLEEMDAMTSLLHQTGAYHRKVPGFQPEMFKV